jgi:hypothetical protein
MTESFRWYVLSLLVAAAGCGSRSAPDQVATPETAKAAPSFAGAVVPLIARHCKDCHGGEKRRGDVALVGAPASDLVLWRKVAEVLRSGNMPPAGRTRPTVGELDAFNAWLDAEAFRVDCTGPIDPGRVTMRRLNRTEYNHTIRDLIGIEFQPAADFPADDIGYGFDNVGDVLSLSPLLIEKYLAAAERVVDEAALSPAVWQRIANPPADDPVPFVLRGQPPLHDAAVKNLRGAPVQEFDAKAQELEKAAVALRWFADRAYRRPITHDELARLVQFVEASQRNGEPTDAGLRLALKAILVSPNFLFRVEPMTNSNQPIDDFELATRLSYFLWASTPDEELFRAAAAVTLHQSDVLTTQVRRMLRDSKSRALSTDFAVQWLQLRALNGFNPDPARFPNFDASLRRAMRHEAELFFDAMVREDRNILDLLDADFTYVNERLAPHYGIAGVRGDEFRRVNLSGTGRGGVLTQAAVLTVTSNPTRTSPVKRGKWILDNLLGSPPPAPPPGADDLKPAPSGQNLTLRQRMESHRSKPECASCHARMDPLGFGLENFDAVGAWRSTDGDAPIDATGALPDGRSFTGPDGLRAILRDRAGDFRRCLAEKLLTYALGRGLTPADDCAVRRIVADTVRDGDRFSALVLAVVRSEPFQSRRVESGESK